METKINKIPFHIVEMESRQLKQLFEQPLEPKYLNLLHKLLEYLSPFDLVNLASTNRRVKQTILYESKQLQSIQLNLDFLVFPFYLNEDQFRLIISVFSHAHRIKLDSISIVYDLRHNSIALLKSLRYFEKLHLILDAEDSIKSFKQANLPIQILKVVLNNEYSMDDERIFDLLACAKNLKRFSLTGGILTTTSISQLQMKNLDKISLKNVHFNENVIPLLINVFQKASLKQLKLLATEWLDVHLSAYKKLINSFFDIQNACLEEFTCSIVHDNGQHQNFSKLYNFTKLKTLKIYFSVQFDYEALAGVLNDIQQLHNVHVNFIEYFAPAPIRCYQYTDEDFSRFSMLSTNFKEIVLNISEQNINIQTFDSYLE